MAGCNVICQIFTNVHAEKCYLILELSQYFAAWLLISPFLLQDFLNAEDLVSQGQKAVEDPSDVKLSLTNISASWDRGPGQQPSEEVYMFVYVNL